MRKYNILFGIQAGQDTPSGALRAVSKNAFGHWELTDAENLS
jgi:hypothetical protein